MKSKILRLAKNWLIYLRSYHTKKDPMIWVFGEWFGKRCGDNCTYLANYVVKRNSDIKIFWICDESTDTSDLNKKISVVVRDSKMSDDILNRAGAIFLNQNFLDVSSSEFNKYGKALSINFWHGFPWKKIGHDGSKRQGLLFDIYCKMIDPIEKATKYVTVSDEYTKRIKSAFGVKGKQLINSGYPRNSIFYSAKEIQKCRDYVCNRVANSCPWLIDKEIRIVTYMPTFRDNGDKCANLCTLFDNDFIEYLKENNIVIIQKAHFVESVNHRQYQNQNNVINVNDIEASVLMAGTDVLISDYSSCIFDFLLLNRPIIHFVYDYEQYRMHDRGLYYEIEDVRCGDVVYKDNELQEAIRNALSGNDDFVELRNKRKRELLSYENECACENVYKYACDYLNIKTD